MLFRSSLVVLACVLLVPAPVSAQQASGIAGLVRDTSGAVLPGVTVEAASPALIEKVRTVVTDGEGRYSIVDLRLGTYVVTFSLAGFSTVRREGVELPGGFTATVNADMKVGALEETITVTGAAPLVDTQNIKRAASASRFRTGPPPNLLLWPGGRGASGNCGRGASENGRSVNPQHPANVSYSPRRRSSSSRTPDDPRVRRQTMRAGAPCGGAKR